MEKVKDILELARNGIPQALSRFNDGEIGIIMDHNFIAARGDQKGSVELQAALRDAILHEQENYWKGYPCPICMVRQWKYCVDSRLYNPEYPYNTYAVVNTNRNWEFFYKGLYDALEGKKVVWVSGNDQNINVLPFDIIKHIVVRSKNSWVNYYQILDDCLKIVKPGYFFIVSCGPMARVLVKDLFDTRSDATYLDLGSTYDPFTRDVWHKCHKGTLKPCKGCN